MLTYSGFSFDGLGQTIETKDVTVSFLRASKRTACIEVALDITIILCGHKVLY